jgi:hypothetical protein
MTKFIKTLKTIAKIIILGPVAILMVSTDMKIMIANAKAKTAK